jgi:hypothetical protein
MENTDKFDSVHSATLGWKKPYAWLAGLTTVLLSLFVCAETPGQEPQRGVTVTTLPRPELDPLGIPWRGFLVFPTLAYSGAFNSNVFATQTDVEADFISIISPQGAVRSNWNRNALNVFAGADIGRYANFPGENYNDWNFSAEGQVDATDSIQFAGGGRFEQLHEDRGDPDALSRALEPTVYTSAGVFASYSHERGPVSFAFSGDFDRVDYEDVPGIIDGQAITFDQDDRDRNQYEAGLRSGYEFMPDYEAFVRARAIFREYDQLQNITEFDRSSDGYEVVAGFDSDFGGLLYGDVFAGYRQQDYISPLPDIGTPTFGVSVDWNVTTLTTVNINVSRSIVETNDAFFSGYVSTSGEAGIDHALRRNLLINVTLGITDNDFAGIANATRDERYFGVGTDINYTINRHFRASLTYQFTERNSSENRMNFTRQTVSLQVRLQP